VRTTGSKTPGTLTGGYDFDATGFERLSVAEVRTFLSSWAKPEGEVIAFATFQPNGNPASNDGLHVDGQYGGRGLQRVGGTQMSTRP